MFGSMSAALTMKISWLPYLIALLALLLCLISILILPNSSVTSSSIGSPTYLAHGRGMRSQSETPQNEILTSFILRQARSDFRLMAVLTAFFLITVRLPMGTDLVLLYVSKRYDWRINQVSLLIRCSPNFSTMD